MTAYSGIEGLIGYRHVSDPKRFAFYCPKQKLAWISSSPFKLERYDMATSWFYPCQKDRYLNNRYWIPMPTPIEEDLLWD